MMKCLHLTFAPALLALTACIPVPLADPDPYREETIGVLGPGATQADVLFTLGDPFWTHNEDQVFVYASDEMKMGYLIILGNQTAGGVSGGVVSKRHLLVIEFDDDGRVCQLEKLDLGIGMTIAGTETVGYDDVVCTSWKLCLTHSGATIVKGGE